MTTEEVLVTDQIPAGLGEHADVDLENLGQKEKRRFVGKLVDQASTRSTVIDESGEGGEILEDILPDLVVRDLDSELLLDA